MVMSRKHDKHRELAYNLYVMHGYTQKDIAVYVGVSEPTICKWKEKYEWDNAKAAHSVTSDRIVIDLLYECSAIRTKAKADDRNITNQEADILVKLANTVHKLKKGNDPATVMGVMKGFTHWLMNHNLELAKSIVDHQKDYIRHIIQQ